MKSGGVTRVEKRCVNERCTAKVCRKWSAGGVSLVRTLATAGIFLPQHWQFVRREISSLCFSELMIGVKEVIVSLLLNEKTNIKSGEKKKAAGRVLLSALEGVCAGR